MRSNYLKISIFLGVMAFLVLADFTVLAATPQEERKALEEQLKVLDEEAARLESDIQATQQQKQNLQNQISILQGKIKKLNIQIRQGNLMIEDLKGQVADTEEAIDRTTTKLNETKEELKNLLRLLYQQNHRDVLEIFLTEDSLSDFLGNLANLETLNVKISQALDRVKSLKTSLEDEKTSLDQEKDGLQKVVALQTLQKQNSEGVKAQQETILQVTKGKEALYQQYLAENRKKAAEIRSRIFETIGVSQAPTFGQAYDIAKRVSQLTGIRPAFLLAIITQESNLGKNVGQCNCSALQSCKHPELSWQDVMKPNRDWQPFQQIAAELGKDPSGLPVSCPMYLNGQRMGYGGAMGPAQFIPSTWTTYKSRIEVLTGRKPADPWNITDAFFAAALYLTDYGAGAKTYSAEWKAAMIYFSGSTNTRYRFYGDSAMNIAKGLEDDIAILEQQLSAQ